ncbi:MAG: hypothetical protein E7256_15250 [Lachnospiraceae bacterium]|nr:hypothetical protein [Lachnospiraceae bacterium]
MRKTIAILHSDKAYAAKLMEYMKNQEGFFYEVVAFSEQESFLSYRDENSITLLLCAEEYKEKLVPKTEKILYLSDSPVDEENQIFMYQSAKRIMEQIRKKSRESVLYRRTEEKKKKQIIGIFSPYEGCFRSIVPEVMASFYAKDKEVLFISINAFYDGNLLSAQENCYGVSELIYYSKQGKETLKQKLDSCMQMREGISLIAGCEHYTDLFEMTEKESRIFMECLLEEEEHDVIIIDFGCGTHLMEEALLGCNIVYELSYSNPAYERRDACLKRQLLQSIPKEKVDRIRMLPMPQSDGVSAEDFQRKSRLLSELEEQIREFIRQENGM